MTDSGRWTKIVLGIVGLLALAGVASVLLDPGLGTPDESRRVRHPLGFSFVPPRGWGASVFYGDAGGGSLRVSPERSTGRQPSIVISTSDEPRLQDAEMRPFTFQDLPASVIDRETKYEWYWRVRFERDGRPFQIQFNAPIAFDVTGSPHMPFLESFRVESITGSPSPTTGPATRPVTVPGS